MAQGKAEFCLTSSGGMDGQELRELAEQLQSGPGLLFWPIHTSDRCHQRDVSDPTTALGPAKDAATGALLPGWQMKSKYSQCSLPVLL